MSMQDAFDTNHKFTEGETMQKITEEMKIHEQWYEQARKQTLESLPAFINELLTKYEHDYGTICHALTAGALATLRAMDRSEQGGITRFQAGCIMWEFIRHWMHEKGAVELIKYDEMLYPQYQHKFEKTISKKIYEDLQKKANQKLEEGKDRLEDISPKVVSHWKYISAGGIPFGYCISEE